MDRRTAIAALIALVAVAAPARAADAPAFPYEQFLRFDLADLVARMQALEGPAPPPGRHTLWMDRITKVRFEANYVGDKRAITPHVADMILQYSRAGAGPDPDGYASQYVEAWAFEDQGRRYWFPVQHQVADFFAEELRPGQRIALWALVVGGEGDAGKPIEPLILIQEFDADPATTH